MLPHCASLLGATRHISTLLLEAFSLRVDGKGLDFDAFSGAAIESPNIAAMPDPMITLDGTMFVSENSQMRKAKAFVGNAFEVAPSEAIKAAASHI